MSTTVLDWTISNFLDQPDKPILSRRFSIPDYKQIELSLTLYPRGSSKKSSDYVTIYVSKLADEFDAEIEFDLVIIGPNVHEDKSMTFKKVFESQSNRCNSSLPKVVSRTELADNFLTNGSLSIQVKNVRVHRVVELKGRLDAIVINWDIDDFMSRNDVQLTSDKFTIPGHPLIKWQLICYPNGKSDKKTGYLSIKLDKCADDCEIEIEFKLMVADGEGKAKASLTDKKCFTDSDREISWERFTLRNKLKDCYLDDGTLKIQVKVFRILRVDYLNDYLNRRLNKEPLDLDSFNEHSDFCLKTGDKTFDVQKYVLAKESPYFKTMLDGNFKEKKKNEVDLSQFKPEVIQEVIRYIYTGQLYNFDKFSEQLIIAADYFQMDDLKSLCQANMSFRISLDNCLKFLLTADQANASPLKEAAMRFLNKNKSRFNKQALTKFFKQNVELGIEWMLSSS